jgi:hypothetical protein
MVVIVQHENELLFNSIQNFVQENVYGAFGVLREFAGGFLQIGKKGFAKAWDKLLNAETQVTKKDRRIGIGVVQLVPDKLTFVCA